MIDLTRRSILSGMLSILAASTTSIIPAPARALSGNILPRIYGNGRDYDAEGFQALFDGKDVIIPQDKLQITGAKGLIFHHGTFVIDREVYTNGCRMEIESAVFDGQLLRWWEAFFTHLSSRENAITLSPQKVRWLRSEGHMAIDVGGHQFSTASAWMSESNRFRPKARKDI